MNACPWLSSHISRGGTDQPCIYSHAALGEFWVGQCPHLDIRRPRSRLLVAQLCGSHLFVYNLELEQMILKAPHVRGPQGSQGVLMEAKCLGDLQALCKGCPRNPALQGAQTVVLCLLPQEPPWHGPHGEEAASKGQFLETLNLSGTGQCSACTHMGSISHIPLNLAMLMQPHTLIPGKVNAD